MLAEFLEEPFPRGPVAALLIEGDGVELRAHDDFFRAPLPRRGLEPVSTLRTGAAAEPCRWLDVRG